MRAIRWVGDPSAAPRFVELTRHAELAMRREAVNTLKRLPTPESVAAVVKALADEDPTVRRSAAIALEVMDDVGRDTVVARLRAEQDLLTRGALYGLLVDLAGPGAFELLTEFGDRPDPRDRRYWLQALGRTDDSRRIAVLAESVANPDLGIGLEGVRGLGRIADDEAVAALIEGVSRAPLPVLRIAVDELARLGVRRAGTAIHKRLVTDLLTRDLSDPALWDPLERVTLSLVELGQADGLKEIREKTETQSDSTARKILGTSIERLEWVRRNGRKTSRWIETTKSDDPELRRLAWRQLGWSGSAEATRALVSGFENAGRDDRLAILDVLGEFPAGVARPLLERVLVDPEFDTFPDEPLRDMAAWSARRIGGPEMRDILEAAVRRRDGRDARVLIYAALAAPDRAVPLLNDVRRKRMRYIGWTRAIEQERLDWLAARLVHGRSVDQLDVPPSGLTFR